LELKTLEPLKPENLEPYFRIKPSCLAEAPRSMKI
jgi:hypothetical protein